MSKMKINIHLAENTNWKFLLFITSLFLMWEKRDDFSLIYTESDILIASLCPLLMEILSNI